MSAQHESSSPTLSMARQMRAEGIGAIAPSRLYESAARESREHYAATPTLVDEKTRDLYRHAMIEAGALIPEGAPGPSTRCSVCGWEADDDQVEREGRMMDVAQRYQRERNEARELVRRAAPFVNAVAAMADDKGPALKWLADAASTPGVPRQKGK